MAAAASALLSPVIPASPVSAAPTTYVVDTLADGAVPGTSLREAITAANLNAGADTIVFAPGLTGTISMTGPQFDITDSVTITGPGASRLVIDAGGASRIFHAFTPGTSLRVSGLTLRNGSTAGLGGGLLFGQGTDLVIDDLVVVDSESGLGGGGIAVEATSGSVTVTDSRLESNTALAGDGGGLRINDTGGAVTIRSVVAESNVATAGEGGGVYSLTATQPLVLEGVTASDNQAAQEGGGIRVGAASVVLDGVVAERNMAQTAGGLWAEATTGDVTGVGVDVIDNVAVNGYGGGVTVSQSGDVSVDRVQAADNSSGFAAGFAASAPNGAIDIARTTIDGNASKFEGAALYIFDALTASIVDSAVTANVAPAAAGALVSNVADVAVTTSTLSGNSATAGDGGGWYALGSTVSISDSTISGNSARDDGGGIFVNDGVLDLRNVTIVDNSAGGLGGGIAQQLSPPVEMRFVVVANNDAPLHPDMGAPFDAKGLPSLVTTNGVPVINATALVVGADPLLGPLGDNGGSTRTHLPLPASPLVDLGVPLLLSPGATDQRGGARVVGTLDIGAVEVQESELPIWIPVEPARLFESRPGNSTADGLFQTGAIQPSFSQFEFTVAGRAGVPDDAVAAIVNITAIAPAGDGYATAHACLANAPDAASLNYTAGVTLGNEVVAGLDDDGDLCVFVRTQAHFTVDVVGYVPASSPYTAVDPARLLETRDGFQTIDGLFEVPKPGAGHHVEFDVAGRAGVPADAAAAVLYVAAVNPTDPGHVTAWNCDGGPPLASILNHVPGVNRGSEVVVTLSDTGTACLFSFADIDLTADVVGFLPAGTEYRGIALPERLLDTRAGTTTVDGEFAGEGIRPAGSTLELEVRRRGSVGTLPRTIVVNLTAVAPATDGHVTIWNCEGGPPLASSLNYTAGVTGGNDLVIGVSDTGTICIFTLTAVHLVADVSGFTEPTFVLVGT